MTIIAAMGTGLEHLVIDIIQPELALFVDSAQAPVLMAYKAVDLVIGLDVSDRPANNKKYYSCQDYHQQPVFTHGSRALVSKIKNGYVFDRREVFEKTVSGMARLVLY